MSEKSAKLAYETFSRMVNGNGRARLDWNELPPIAREGWIAAAKAAAEAETGLESTGEAGRRVDSPPELQSRLAHLSRFVISRLVDDLQDAVNLIRMHGSDGNGDLAAQLRNRVADIAKWLGFEFKA